jgi:hypothetical protein
MSGPEKRRGRWFEWFLIPLKALVLFTLPLLFFADSKYLPWLVRLDMSPDMLAGWLCLFCAVALAAAGGYQRFADRPEAARGSFIFAVLAFLLGITLSPLFAVK